MVVDTDYSNPDVERRKAVELALQNTIRPVGMSRMFQEREMDDGPWSWDSIRNFFLSLSFSLSFFPPFIQKIKNDEETVPERRREGNVCRRSSIYTQSPSMVVIVDLHLLLFSNREMFSPCTKKTKKKKEEEICVWSYVPLVLSFSAVPDVQFPVALGLRLQHINLLRYLL